MKYSIVALGLLATAGCAKFQTPVDFNGDVPQLSRKSVAYSRPACEVDHVDYILDADILAYEFMNKNGLKVGFNLLEGVFKSIGLEFDISSSQLVSHMGVASIFEPNRTVLNETAAGKGTEFGLKGNLEIQGIGLGFEHYSKTSVSKLTEKSLNKTFQLLAKKMLAMEGRKEWKTRVLMNSKFTNDSVILQVGATAGLRVGDTFSVYNTDHNWNGSACSGTYVTESNKKFVAKVKVIDIQDFYSEAVIVTDGVTNEDIRQGALVLVDALDTTVVKKRSPLGRSVWVRSTDSLPLKFDGKTEVDLKAYATRQIRDVISMEETKGRYYVIDPDLE